MRSIEIFQVESLLTAAAEATDSYSREHVTPFLYDHPDRFNVVAFRREDPLRSAGWRLTLDALDDWRLLQVLCLVYGLLLTYELVLLLAYAREVVAVVTWPLNG